MLTTDNEIEESWIRNSDLRIFTPKLEILWENQKCKLEKDEYISQQQLYSAFDHQGSHVS